MMKIHISFPFKEGPWGGGNQFLKALKKEFEKKELYTQKPEEADVILFNSHHQYNRVAKLKQQYPKTVFVHRIDGPVYTIRNQDLYLDKAIYRLNELLADGTVFQSDWSKKENKKLGIQESPFTITIHNAADKELFNTANKPTYKKGKLKIVTTCWSANPRKGFPLYKYLDKHLDTAQFMFTYIGNSPITFKNTKHIPPLSTKEVAKELQKHHVFLTASQKDPCSNSLIEALQSGLPAIALQDGGHPELIKKGGVCFKNKQELFAGLQQLQQQYTFYQKHIDIADMEDVAKAYIEFMKNIHTQKNKGKYAPKKLTQAKKIRLTGMQMQLYIKKICKKIQTKL